MKKSTIFHILVPLCFVVFGYILGRIECENWELLTLMLAAVSAVMFKHIEKDLKAAGE